MQIADLLTEVPPSFGSSTDPNPVRENDALLEAQLLAITVDAARGVTGLLFEMRVALQIDDGNTGVLVVSGTRRVNWSAPTTFGQRTAWPVVGSEVAATESSFELSLGLCTAATLEIEGDAAAFCTGTVPGLGEAPPDYTSREEYIVANVPNWSSEIELAWVAASRLGPSSAPGPPADA